jgi:hypothetical protein
MGEAAFFFMLRSVLPITFFSKHLLPAREQKEKTDDRDFCSDDPRRRAGREDVSF